MNEDEFNAAIAEFIHRHGVTRCPTACLARTQGRISAADRAALGEYAIARHRRRAKSAPPPFVRPLPIDPPPEFAGRTGVTRRAG